MENVLVTGGAGFIGSHLCEKLVEMGKHVSVLDNLSTGRLENLESIKNDIVFYKTSIRDTADVLSIFRQENIKEIYHLASVVGVKRVLEEPYQTMAVCHESANTLLRYVAYSKIKIFLASSSEVYGNDAGQKFNESQSTTTINMNAPRSSYVIGKLGMELLAKQFYNKFKSKIVIGRLFNTVGPRQLPDYGMVFPNIIQSIVKGRPIEIFGDGFQTRSFIHVKDTVNYIVHLMGHESGKQWGQIYNIGKNNPISINELCSLMECLIIGKIQDRIYVPHDQVYNGNYSDFRARVPDVTKIQSLLPQLYPYKDLGDIIRDVAAQYI